MKKVDALIIGSSAAGFTAAITARRHYPDASLALIRQEEKTLVPCGIPYIFGTLGDSAKNLMPDPALAKNDVELIIGKATTIDREAKIVYLESGEGVGYEKLIMTTGSTPLVPPIPGADLDNVFTIQKDVSYLDHLLDVLKDANDVVVVGGGFIGLEMADECRKLGNKNITVVEMLSHCLFVVFDEDVCVRTEEMLENAGVNLRLSQRVTRLAGNGSVEYVELAGGERIKADVVILGIGVRPNVELAQQTGLTLGPVGAVAVDRHMMTSDPNIFAAGDCAEKVSFFTGKPDHTWLASVATAEARIAAANLFEIRRANKGAVSVFSTKIGDLSIGLAGIRERDASEAGIAYVVGQVGSHPTSIPAALPRRHPATGKTGVPQIFRHR
jgi:NADH oxidase (H2O2-forming)